MKLYLSGGYNHTRGDRRKLCQMIKKTLEETKPKYFLWVPFARTGIAIRSKRKKEDWFNRDIDVEGIEFLNAKYTEDLENCIPQETFVFISGGNNNENTVNLMAEHEGLDRVLRTAKWLWGDSAGACIWGEVFRKRTSNDTIIKGLGYLKDTTIMPHYSEKNRQDLMRKIMKKGNVENGVGIDELTVLEGNRDNIMTNHKIRGQGRVYFEQIAS